MQGEGRRARAVQRGEHGRPTGSYQSFSTSFGAQAGGPHVYREVRRYVFAAVGKLLGENLLKRKQVKWLLAMLKGGIKPSLVPATSDCQLESRAHQKRLARVLRELGALGVEAAGEERAAPCCSRRNFPTRGC